MSENTQIAKRAEGRLTVQAALDSDNYKKRFEEVLRHRAPQFMSSLISISNSPGLRDADARSVIAAGMIAATLDLPINPNLGFAHIVAYKQGDGPKVAQFQMGYKGYIQLALRTGQYKTINDAVIPHGVLVSYNELTGDLVLDWSKADYTKDPDGYAFFFRLVNGFEKTVFWTHERAMNHGRKYSKSFNFSSSGWKTNPQAMCLKSVIASGLRKYGLLSIELQSALVHDHGTQRDIDTEIEYVDSTIGEPSIQPARIPLPAASADSRTVSEPIEAELVPENPEPEPAAETSTPEPQAAATPEPEKKKAGRLTKKEAKPEPKAEAASEPAPKAKPENPLTAKIIELGQRDGITRRLLFRTLKDQQWLSHQKYDVDKTRLAELPDDELQTIVDEWETLAACARELPQEASDK